MHEFVGNIGTIFTYIILICWPPISYSRETVNRINKRTNENVKSEDHKCQRRLVIRGIYEIRMEFRDRDRNSITVHFAARLTNYRPFHWVTKRSCIIDSSRGFLLLIRKIKVSDEGAPSFLRYSRITEAL